MVLYTMVEKTIVVKVPPRNTMVLFTMVIP